ncbi:UNVERIFIED_ORG: hypothetical protein J2W38_006044 [Variovorax paradoxus]|nr:hypothetical protein [Variovorax paradoxus]
MAMAMVTKAQYFPCIANRRDRLGHATQSRRSRQPFPVTQLISIRSHDDAAALGHQQALAQSSTKPRARPA